MACRIVLRFGADVIRINPRRQSSRRQLIRKSRGRTNRCCEDRLAVAARRISMLRKSHVCYRSLWRRRRRQRNRSLSASLSFATHARPTEGWINMRDLTRVLVSAPLRRVFRYAFGTHARILALLCVLTMAGWPALAADGRLASILIDANDGRVLESANADLPRYPASLTKMMTLYLTFEALDDGRFTLDQPLTVSARAGTSADQAGTAGRPNHCGRISPAWTGDQVGE